MMNCELSISCEFSLIMCLQLHSLHIRDDSQGETVKHLHKTSLILFSLIIKMVPSGFRTTQELLCVLDYYIWQRWQRWKEVLMHNLSSAA